MKRNSLPIWGGLVLAAAAGLACNPLSLAQSAQAPVQVATQAAGLVTQVGQTPGSSSQPTQPAAPTEPASTTAPEATGTPVQIIVGKQGQRLIGGNFALTVTKTETNPGTSDVQPDQGYVFLLVHFVLENVSTTDNVFIAPTSFQVKDSTGRLSDFTSLGFLTDELQSGNYAPGGKLTGTIGFQIGQKASGFHLLFDYGGDRPMDVTLAP